jgi:hypothetical protein
MKISQTKKIDTQLLYKNVKIQLLLYLMIIPLMEHFIWPISKNLQLMLNMLKILYPLPIVLRKNTNLAMY